MNQAPKHHDTFSLSGRREGFTLIELLVVVAIIALLVSIIVPAVTKARDLAESAVCQANLRSIGAAFHTYAGDNNGSLPLLGDALFDVYNPANRMMGKGFWIDRFAKGYLGLSIPSDPTKAGDPRDDSLSSPLGCPSDEHLRASWMIPGQEYSAYFGYKMSFGANYYRLDHRYGNYPGDGWDRTGRTKHARLWEISADSECLLVCDIEKNSWARFTSPSWPVYNPANEETVRHFGGMNTLYVDGHVSWMDTIEQVDIGGMGGRRAARLIFGLDEWPDNW